MSKLTVQVLPVTKIRINDGSNWVVATIEKTFEQGRKGGILHVSIYNTPTITAYFPSTGVDIEQFIIECNTSYLINKILLNGLDHQIGDFSAKTFARSFLKKYRTEIKAYCRRGEKERNRFKRLSAMHKYHILDGQDYEGVDSWGSFGCDSDDGIKEAIEVIIGESIHDYHQSIDDFLQNDWQWDQMYNPEYEWVAKNIELLKTGLKQHIEESNK